MLYGLQIKHTAVSTVPGVACGIASRSSLLPNLYCLHIRLVSSKNLVRGSNATHSAKAKRARAGDATQLLLIS